MSKMKKEIKAKDKVVKTKPEAEVPVKRRGKKEINSVTGMRDLLPQDEKYWSQVRKVAEKIATDYGFGRIETPIIEYVDLFARGVGKGTDIVEKEMFAFTDQGGDLLCVRPEGTASVVRAYVQHGMVNQSQPAKFFYMGPMYRHEKPQAGRYRQFFQLGFEAIGEANPTLDAQMILMGWNSLNDLGIESVIQVNSIGCPDCRDKYKQKLVKYYKEHQKSLCENCLRRLTINPLRLLDCKEDDCKALKKDAPQILDFVCDDCKNHFMKVVEYLDELNLPYALNPNLVRGLDYYTKTVFEYWAIDDTEGKSALGAGGRYDGLVEILGGRENTPACGLAMGMDRVVAKLREKNIAVPEIDEVDVFVAQLGESAKRKAMNLYEKLRKSGKIKLAQAFYKNNLKGQLEMANKCNAKFTLILGQKELSDGTILLRDMEGGVQEVIDFNKIEEEVINRVSKYIPNNAILVEDDENVKRAKLSGHHEGSHDFSDNNNEGFDDFNDGDDDLGGESGAVSADSSLEEIGDNE